MPENVVPASVTLEWAVQAVPCPSCRARRGEQCRTPGNRLAPCHARRYEAAKRHRRALGALERWNRACLVLVGLLPAALGAQTDSARYQVTWTAPAVDLQHPAATFYHWQLVLGDTTTSPLAGYKSVGTTWGFLNVYGGRYGYSPVARVTVTVARPTVDSLGPFRLEVQPGYYLPDTTMALGPYTYAGAWWSRPRGANDPPYPTRITGYAVQEIPWP